ncbi:MAG: RagB/SusD family nutrient uptake outer membrane protein [Bacteroidales bacterium]|nr:RagB/SusD family nutrient uptake outer membrane protein [Bacteroidales bacterium]
MKTFNKLVLLLGVSALFATSCSDSFFDRYPTDSMQMETYGKEDTEVQNILYDAYYYFRNISGSVILVNSLATDEAYDNKRNNSGDHIALNESSWDSTLGITSGIWSNSYYMINRCNTVLERLDNVSDKNKAQYRGEALFFRAYAYFNLVRFFGPAPLVTSVISNYQDLYKYDRESVDKIYTQIVNDLNQAINDLPAEYTDATKVGRATKIAAQTMLGDVYLTQKNYSLAAQTLKNVVDYSAANPAKLGLEKEISQIYNSLNPNGKEVILAAQFNNGATVVSNGLMTNCIPNIVPADQPARVYADGTKSKINISNGNSILLMTWELWNALKADSNDKRIEMVYAGAYDQQATSIPSAEVEVVTVNGADFACFPTSLKYFDQENESLGQSRSSCDNIVYRYADVLLMYAEALNEGTSTTEAVKYLNEVRTRAGVANTTAANQADVRLAIENERFLELHFEGHRWFDLVRTGRITPVMEAHYKHRVPGLAPVIQASNNGMVVTEASSTSGTALTWKWTGKTAPVLFAVPYDQLQLTKWTQNELY